MSVIHYGADELGALHACARKAASDLGLPQANKIADGILKFLADYAKDNAAVYRWRYSAHKMEPGEGQPVPKSAIAAASLRFGATPEKCEETVGRLGGGLSYQINEAGSHMTVAGVEAIQAREEAMRDLIAQWVKRDKPPPPPVEPDPSLDDAIKRLRDGLKKQTGRAWSVKRGSGTAYSWITVDAPPKRKTCDRYGLPPDMPDADRREAIVASVRQGIHPQYAEQDADSHMENLRKYPAGKTGSMCNADNEALKRVFRQQHGGDVGIPPGAGCRALYVALAEGREPTRDCERNWD